MISLGDTFTLSRTKLKSNKMRLIITTVVSGLLFGILIAATSLVYAVTDSAKNYSDKASSGTYIVSAIPDTYMDRQFEMGDQISAETRAEVQKLHDQYVAKRKAAAKKYNIDYDPKTEQQPFTEMPFADPSMTAAQRQMLNEASVAVRQYQEEKYDKFLKQKNITADTLKSYVSTYNPTGIYPIKNWYTANMKYLVDNKEDLTKQTKQNYGSSPEDYMALAIENSSFTSIDQKIMQRFILPENEARRKNASEAIPVIVSWDAAVKTFGTKLNIPERPKDSKSQIEWVKSLNEKFNGFTYTACYRNTQASNLIDQARQMTQEIAAGKNTPGYQKPALVYGLPKETCGPATIERDVRTTSEKKQAQNQQEFDREFEAYEDPVTRLVKFQIVGLTPAQVMPGMNMDLQSFMAGILQTSYGNGAIVLPTQMYDVLPENIKIDDIFKASSTDRSMQATNDYSSLVTFGNLDDARDFMNNKNCTDSANFGYVDLSRKCPSGKQFYLNPYGSNYLLVDEIKNAALPTLAVFMYILLAVATIIVWAMMGRVIADSRRETAVFRALGAKRRDIAAVYLLYSMAVAVRIIVFALVLAFAIVMIVEILFAADATRYAALSYGIFDESIKFSFIGLGWPTNGYIILGIFIMALIAVIFPLIRNVRRNPIRDMRDE